MNDKPEDSNELLRKVTSEGQEAPIKPVQDTSAYAAVSSDDKQILLSEAAIETVGALGSVAGLPQPTRDESVEEARKILRWLRNMEFADRDVEQWLDSSNAPKVVTAKKEALQKLVRIMSIQIHQALLRNLELRSEVRVSNAIDALQAIALTIAEHTFNMLPDQHPKLAALEQEIDAMPESALMRQSQPLGHLLDVIELGMERATGQEVSDLSAAFRLQTLGEELQQTARQLQSAETLGMPTREESLDLAQDILQKMKCVSFGEKTVKELIETGKAEDKAAFAQSLAEMAGIYRNLMAEAVALNPNILQDYRVQEANDAVEGFAHAVKLMAAKEIPASAAATQQISAEAAQAPGKWGSLSNRTVDRLVKSAEAGLAKAIEQVAEQQERQQENEQAQDAVENALQQADQKRRKKRRSDSKSRSGKGSKSGKRQRKQQLMEASAADAYVMKEGRFNTDAQAARTGGTAPMSSGKNSASSSVHGGKNTGASAMSGSKNNTPSVLHGGKNNSSPMPGLKMEDMETIRKLGGSLRDIGKQLKDIAKNVTTVTTDDKILPSPNEQSAAQRIIDTELQKPTNPRGNNGPRV